MSDDKEQSQGHHHREERCPVCTEMAALYVSFGGELPGEVEISSEISVEGVCHDVGTGVYFHGEVNNA